MRDVALAVFAAVAEDERARKYPDLLRAERAPDQAASSQSPWRLSIATEFELSIRVHPRASV